jgi:flavin reductase (DIM6/NTAB) family NADH-FMN oxidoreductase RutF
MFYRPDEPHGLRGDPLNAIVVPRPIGWISTLDVDGRANLAPYSFFNAVAYRPPQVMHHPNTIDGLHFKTALPFTGAVPAAPRQRRTLASR